LLAALLKNIQAHLRPKGIFIAQLLNYDRILKIKPRTFATDIDKDLLRLKQYRYKSGYIDFVVTLIDSSQIPPAKKVHISRLKPWKKDELLKYASRAGFAHVEIYGDYFKSDFDQYSKDSILIAQVE
jgi:hypothetical protein